MFKYLTWWWLMNVTIPRWEREIARARKELGRE